MTVDIPVPKVSRHLPGRISSFHDFLSKLAQESLEPYWASMPNLPGQFSVLRDAARQALAKFHGNEVNEDAMLDVFVDALPVESKVRIVNFVEHFSNNPNEHMLGLWIGAFSSNQRAKDFLPISPEIANEVLASFRRDVRGATNGAMEILRQAVQKNPLSPWDMFLHSTYQYCFDGSGQFPGSMILIELNEALSNANFEKFLRNSVLTLSDADQRAVTEAVRAFWADIWSDDPGGLVASLDKTSPNDAKKIPSARELLS